MKHLSEQELLDLFYGEASPEVSQHAEQCAECRSQYREWKHTLDSWREFPVPERGPSYGKEVWIRLAPALEKPRRRIWLLAPALAAMLVIAFVAGIWTEEKRTADRERTRERLLLIAMSDHLDRSQIVLTELLHANPATFDINAERGRARDLLEENRLLRQSALQLGDRPHAAVLDDLERVLLTLANAPANAADETKMLQERVEDGRLLWKVRLAGSNAREKGQKL